MSESLPTPTDAVPSQRTIDMGRLELLDLLLEASADGFLDWQLDSNGAHYSERLLLLLGYEDGNVPTSPWAWLELAHPEDRPMVAKDLEDLVAGDWPFDTTFRVKHPIAGWRWLRVRAAAHRDATNRATRLVASFSDVTSQVRAERRLMSLLNAVPDLLIRVRADSSVVDIRIPESCVVHASQLPKVGDRLCDSAFAQHWWHLASNALSAALQDRRVTHFEGQGGRGPDETCDVDIRVIPSSDDEVLLVIRDITAEKRQREQSLQSQKLEAIGQLAAGIAHEINTPLQFVGDNLHFLAEAAGALTQILSRYRDSVSPEMSSTLKTAESELDIDYMTDNLRPACAAAIDGIQRVSVIVRAMKAFAHPGPKERRPEDLNYALETTITICTNVWKYVADIEREFTLDLPKVDCVIGEINQVFLNLITNAAHAIGDVVGNSGSKGKILISTRCSGDCVEVRVTDTGRGIPEAIRNRIFEPFFTTKEVGRGTGQGLPLARAIVLQHRGSLDFETVPGRGTTFIVSLPVARDPQASHSTSTSP